MRVLRDSASGMSPWSTRSSKERANGAMSCQPAFRAANSRRASGRSTPTTWAFVPSNSISRIEMSRRLSSIGCPCRPTRTTRHPRGAMARASVRPGRDPETSYTTDGISPSVASSSARATPRPGRTTCPVPRDRAMARRSSLRSETTTVAPSSLAAYTRNAPIPPAPMITAASSCSRRPRRMACTAIDMGVLVGVGSADPHGADLHEDLPAPGCGRSHILKADIVLPVKDGGSHVGFSSAVGPSSGQRGQYAFVTTSSSAGNSVSSSAPSAVTTSSSSMRAAE